MPIENILRVINMALYIVRPIHWLLFIFLPITKRGQCIGLIYCQLRCTVLVDLLQISYYPMSQGISFKNAIPQASTTFSSVIYHRLIFQKISNNIMGLLDNKGGPVGLIYAHFIFENTADFELCMVWPWQAYCGYRVELIHFDIHQQLLGQTVKGYNFLLKSLVHQSVANIHQQTQGNKLLETCNILAWL